jgi:hypothetical protein
MRSAEGSEEGLFVALSRRLATPRDARAKNTRGIASPEVMMMRLTALGIALFTAILLAGCANMPGADGRYATHDRGAGNRENHGGLPVTPYVPR